MTCSCENDPVNLVGLDEANAIKLKEALESTGFISARIINTLGVYWVYITEQWAT